MISWARIAPPRAEKMMKKLLVASAMLALIGCSNSDGAEKSLAQCRLKAPRPEGVVFQQDSAAKAGSTSSAKGDDTAYRDFVETCMQAKGFKLVPMYNGQNSQNSVAGCWLEDGKSPFPKANADNPECYKAQ